MITKKFKTPLYGTEFTVIIAESQESINKFFKNKNFEPPDKGFDGWVYKIGEMVYCVFLSLEKGYPTPGIIAHEAKHLVNNIFIEISHELDPYNDEPECYLLSWVVNRIHELLPKNN